MSLVVFAFAVLPLLWLAEPIWRIRIGVLQQDRIGHLAANTCLFLRRYWRDGGPKRTTHVFLAWNAANRTLLRMFQRQLPILESRWLCRASIGFLPLLTRTRFFAAMPYDPSAHCEFSEPEPILSFTQDEERRGRAGLSAMGVGPDDWFVCIHSRDPSYLARRTGFGKQSTERLFKDCSIENYLDAARWIVEQGGFVIRMGAIVEQPLPDLGPRIIDYATRFRDEFMDIYLSAHCRFFLGCTSGLVAVPWLFDAPVAGANFAPLTDIGLGHRTMFIPMLLHRKSDGEPVPFPELDAMGLFDDAPGHANADIETYDTLDLEWRENSPDEVLGLAIDMMDRLEGRAPPQDSAALQDAYAAHLVPGHRTPHAPRIGARFVLKHRRLMDTHELNE